MKIKCDFSPNKSIFSLGINIAVGSRNENDFPNGISHFLEHYIFRKSKRFSGKEIAKKFESFGALVNAFTAKDQTSFYLTAQTENFTQVAQLLFEIICTPDFLPEEVQKEKLIIAEEINSYLDDNEEIIFEIAATTLYGQNNLCTPITGTIESIEQINSELLEKFHSLHYQTENMIIASSGGISEEMLLKVFDNNSSKTNLKHLTNFKNLDIKNINYSRNIVKGQSTQGHILYFKVIKNESEDQRYALAILNLILGDGISSRLYQSVREEFGISYNIYSSINRYTDLTEISVYASFDENKLSEIEEEIDKQVNLIAQNSITQKEFSTAKSILKTFLLIDDESSSSRISTLGREMILGEEHKTTHQLIEEIEGITLETIKKVASKTLSASNFSKTIILPE